MKFLLITFIVVAILFVVLVGCSSKIASSDTPETDSKIENTAESNFVIDVWNTICQKCNYGDEIEKLNRYERVIFVTQSLEMEVNNGGFDQFFFNSSGNFGDELVDAFTEIGALKTAKICEKALSVFNGNVPTNWSERQEILLELDCDDLLDECDNDFYDYEDNLEELNRAYILKYREFFEYKQHIKEIQ